jgi:hypothetical protein
MQTGETLELALEHPRTILTVSALNREARKLV